MGRSWPKHCVSLGKYPSSRPRRCLTGKLDSVKPEVRAAAIETLGELRAAEGREPLVAAARGPGSRKSAAPPPARQENCNERQAIEPLLKLAADGDALVRSASLDSLRLLKEPRAVPLAVAALGDRQTEQIALQYLRDLGGPEQAGAVAELAKRNPSLDVLTAAVQTLTTWRERAATTATQQQELDRAVAEIQGASGSLVRWKVSGPRNRRTMRIDEEPADARIQFAAGTEGRLVIAAKGAAPGQLVPGADRHRRLGTDRRGIARVQQRQPADLAQRQVDLSPRKAAATSASIPTAFPPRWPREPTAWRCRVEAASPESPVEFHLRFRRKSALAEHERLLQAALSRPGNPERGRAIFLDVEKSLCLKCHRLGDQGERTGPELTGLGSRFSRIYIAESILEPSRTIAPSFGTVVVVLENGQVSFGRQGRGK